VYLYSALLGFAQIKNLCKVENSANSSILRNYWTRTNYYNTRLIHSKCKLAAQFSQNQKMPIPKSPSITITAAQRAVLEPLAKSRTASKRDNERATLILHLENHPNSVTASVLRCNYLTAKHWRLKWLSFQPIFENIEASDEPDRLARLKEAIFECLGDAPRPGAPPTYTAEQYCQMMAVCLEDPRDSGQPITHWTHQELADEIQKRGIATISKSHLGSFLKRQRPQTPFVQVLAESPLHTGRNGNR
jgi:putative transposase